MPKAVGGSAVDGGEDRLLEFDLRARFLKWHEKVADLLPTLALWVEGRLHQYYFLLHQALTNEAISRFQTSLMMVQCTLQRA